MEYRILGTLEVADGGRAVEVGSGKQRALLALLLIHAGRGLHVDQIADELWEGAPPASAVKTVQVLVSRLRRALGPAAEIETDAGGYRLHVDGSRLDARAAEQLIAGGRSALDRRDLVAAAASLRDALALWRGESLQDFRYKRFAAAEAARLDELRWSATEDRLEAELGLGRHVEVGSELEALVAEQPLRERLWAHRIVSLYRCGQQAAALAAYDELRRRLADELGLTPGPGLQQLQQAVLRQDPSLAAPPAAGRVATSFVGRAPEVAQLTEALDGARGRRGSLVVVVGEAGIGKTWLADEFSRRAAQGGGRVVWGRCWEAGGAPAYWPWVQILRSLLRLRPELQSTVESEPELAALLPGVGLSPDPSASDGNRFRLFDAVASFVRRAAGEDPLVVVLDDVHAADVPSILLLEFLATALVDAPVLLLAACRHSPRVARLDRVAHRRLPLRGLSLEEVGALVARISTLEPRSRIGEAIAEETGGNPLFAGELVRLLDESGVDEDSWRRALLHGARSVIERRVEGLTPAAVVVLEEAAVLGRDVTLPVLAEATHRSVGELVDGLGEGVAAGILDQSGDAPPEVRFRHVLYRDALYEQLKPSRRLELHRAVAHALATQHAHELDLHLAEIAHHHFFGATGGDTADAITFGRLAAERARRVLAHEEAARLFERTVRVLDLSPRVDPAERCELLLSLGDAHMRSGNVVSAQRSFRTAAEVAERAGLVVALARAALGYGGPFLLDRMTYDPSFVPLLERALARLGPGVDDSLRVRLLARLGGALRRDAPERAEACSGDAVALARELRDPATLAYALDASFGTLWHSPGNIGRWLATADEIVELAEAAGDQERALEGRHHRIGSLMHLGRIEDAEEEIRALATLAGSLRQPAELWFASVYEGQLAAFRGDFDAADRHLSSALAFAREESIDAWDVSSMRTIQLHAVRREQGRLAEIADELEPFLLGEPSRPLYRCMLVDLYLQIGRTDEARDLLGTLGAGGFRELAGDNEGIYAMALLSEACLRLDDAVHAALLYDVLLPYDGRTATSYPEISTGAVARYLALLASTCDRPADAERHFRDALAENERMGANPWLEHTRREYDAFRRRTA